MNGLSHLNVQGIQREISPWGIRSKFNKMSDFMQKVGLDETLANLVTVNPNVR
jgi:hypothetical protein